MEVRWEKDGPAIGSPSQTFDHFAADMDDRQADWWRRVSQDPTTFAQVQQEIRQQFQQGADLQCTARRASCSVSPCLCETHEPGDPSAGHRAATPRQVCMGMERWSMERSHAQAQKRKESVVIDRGMAPVRLGVRPSPVHGRRWACDFSDRAFWTQWNG
jgi:hypothetical protein